MAKILCRRRSSPSQHDQLALASLNVDEIAGGCSDVIDQLHIRYSAAHPNLDSVGISITGLGAHRRVDR